MFRFLIIVIAILYVLYMLSLLANFSMPLKFTNRKLKFWRLLVPFYYWIATIYEKGEGEVINYYQENK